MGAPSAGATAGSPGFFASPSCGLASVPGAGTAAALPVPFWGAAVPGLATAVAGAPAAAAAAVAGAAMPGPGGGTLCWAAGVTGAAGRGAGAGAGITRRCASAVTRASSSAARSGARPAHSRRRLTSRACAKYSSDRMPSPKTAATPA